MNHAHFTVYRKCGSCFLHLSSFIISKKKWKKLFGLASFAAARTFLFLSSKAAGKDARKDEKKVF
jgi:hypothetical protein